MPAFPSISPLAIRNCLLLALCSISLAPTAIASEHTFSLTVIDDATAAPVPCRVSLTDAEGRSIPLTTHEPSAAVSYDVTNWINPQSIEQHTTLATFPATARLEPGEYRLRVSRGQAWLAHD